jgi:hypothetical protein
LFYLFSAKVEAWHDKELMTERKFREEETTTVAVAAAALHFLTLINK